MTTEQDIEHAEHLDLDDVDPARVEEVLRALAAAVRSYRLYEGSNPMVDRFVATLRQKMALLWEQLPALRLGIEESAVRWNGSVVLSSGESGSDLPFVFYKDGIRELTLLPGFEEEEVLALLAVLARAPSVREEEDDLITLLWQEDLAHLQYRAVEPGVEGIELASGEVAEPVSIDASAVREEEAQPQIVSADEFEETLYFLDDAELRRLQDEIRREAERDLWQDVLNALLDRLEDGDPERQVRILSILGELLPAALSTGRFDRAASVLEEIVALGGRPEVLSPAALIETRKVFEVLGSEAFIVEFSGILENSPEPLADGSANRLLSFFPPSAIAPLMRVADQVEQPAVKRAFEASVQRLAEANRDQVVDLLKADEPSIVIGALRWIGRLEIGTATGEVVRFLRHPTAPLRVAAVETLAALRAAAAGNAIVPLLEDPDRDVRLASAKALGVLSFAAGRSALEAALASKRLKEADRTEKIAFFEAFGRVGDADSVPVLDRILNAKGWLNRAEPTDLRACAALALGYLRHPSAREALTRAANDADPVVRSAVARAIRGES